MKIKGGTLWVTLMLFAYLVITTENGHLRTWLQILGLKSGLPSAAPNSDVKITDLPPLPGSTVLNLG